MFRFTIAACLLSSVVNADEVHWSLKPLAAGTDDSVSVDHFVAKRLAEAGLKMSPSADRRAWLRRVSFDLIGLPPSLQEMTDFLADTSREADARVVDRLLASPRYGERWARHWMDVVRYAETHGHDEDAIRENAWPYRDWLIRAFNDDMTYAEFVREQVAGDVITPQAVEATGFLACGPWDSSSQQGIQDGTVDKKIAQYLDRDDMLSVTMSTFTSTTVHCARCHHHKFDPVTLEDYYALQAVFAGVDKVDRPFDKNPAIARRRAELLAEPVIDDPQILTEAVAWAHEVPQWTVLTPALVRSEAMTKHEILSDGSILFKGIASDKDTYTISGTTNLEKVAAVQVEILSDPSLPLNGPGRAPNGNLHLSEIRVRIDGQSVTIARAAADFNQADWEIEKSVDGKVETAWGIHPEEGKAHQAVFVFNGSVDVRSDAVIEVVLDQLHGGSHLIGRPRVSISNDANAGLGFSPELAALIAVPEAQRSTKQNHELVRAYLKEKNARELATLPEAGKVFAVASQFEAVGNFKPAIRPREVFVLNRGDIQSPLEPAVPGTISALPNLPARFELAETDNEGARRIALADWLVHPDNVLTWRSIVNRVWHWHFGKGIVATPSDFGKMGAEPTHLELLDWLASGFRDNGGSLKWLHRKIVLSVAYRQSSDDRADGLATDVDNKLLWRMNRRRLDAECVHDAVLSLSGKLDLSMGGPSARVFHASKGVHVTPNLDYTGFDPDDPANFRRSIYQFVFRTVPDPLMQALDCPDASQSAPKRDTSSTALQALALLNNRFLVRQSEHMAVNLKTVETLFEAAYGRPPSGEEHAAVTAYADEYGFANACRVIINSSEFLFIH